MLITELDWLLPSPVTQANFQYGTRSVDVRCQHCFFIYNSKGFRICHLLFHALKNSKELYAHVV